MTLSSIKDKYALTKCKGLEFIFLKLAGWFVKTWNLILVVMKN